MMFGTTGKRPDSLASAKRLKGLFIALAARTGADCLALGLVHTRWSRNAQLGVEGPTLHKKRSGQAEIRT